MIQTGVNPTFSCEHHSELYNLIIKYYFTVTPMKCLVKTAVFLCYRFTDVSIYLDSKAVPWT